MTAHQLPATRRTCAALRAAACDAAADLDWRRAACLLTAAIECHPFAGAKSGRAKRDLDYLASLQASYAREAARNPQADSD